MQAIQAATVNAAKMLGPLGDDRGSLAPGKSADIIAVAADPLADIRTLESVAFVMRQGVVYKADGVSAFPR
jgi:imidazolonepropionase-like amidohydrolase